MNPSFQPYVSFGPGRHHKGDKFGIGCIILDILLVYGLKSRKYHAPSLDPLPEYILAPSGPPAAGDKRNRPLLLAVGKRIDDRVDGRASA